ncbi:hypothetical protein, partial [Streptococcus pneumoniae]
IGLTTTLKNAWTTSRQVNFFWVANFNLKFGTKKTNHDSSEKKSSLPTNLLSCFKHAIIIIARDLSCLFF